MSTTKVITPEFTAAFTQSVFTPRKAPGAEKAKYSCVALFEKEPKNLPGSGSFDDLKAAALAAAYAKWGDTDETREKIKKGSIRMPFRKNDEGKYPDKFVYFATLSANEEFKPGVVDRFKGPDGKPVVITDPNVLYSGCAARAAVNAYAYDASGNRGVAFGLNNIQKTGEGDRMDGRKDATEAFDALESGVDEGDLAVSDDDNPMGL